MSTENTHFGAARIGEMLSGCRNIFFIGIGGVSMSSLALITKLRGFGVGGSDRGRSDITDSLVNNGIGVVYGHDASHLNGYDAAVYTVAIKPDNPEYLEARRRSLPCISRADYLGYIMTSRRCRLGIAGMHGKSTCTSMCASVYMAAGTDPTVVSGAAYPAMGGYYRIGKGDNFIFEACEYMDSFLDFNPTTAVILNVELEHVDYFGNIERIRESYGKFAALTGENGTVIYNADDKNAELSVDSFRGRKVTFAVKGNADFTARNINPDACCPEFDISRHGEKLCHVTLKVPGTHNIYNALATAAAAYLDGIAPETIKAGLEAFTGASRRMEYKGELNGAPVYDDYGHHPTEIASTLGGARKLCRGKRLVVAFQPHTYSRTAALFDDFTKALGLADRVLLAPIYAARETDNLGVSSERLARAIGDKATAFADVRSLGEALTNELGENDLAVIMGAGDIENVFSYLKLM